MNGWVRTDCGAGRVHGARQAAGVEQLLHLGHLFGYGDTPCTDLDIRQGFSIVYVFPR